MGAPAPKPWEMADAREMNKMSGEAEGPHVIADRADLLIHAIVPSMPEGLSPLAGRLALSVDEAAPALGISVRTLRQAIRNGNVPSMMLEGRRLIPTKALERHLEAMAYTESGALDAWETALAQASVTRVRRAQREAARARADLAKRTRSLRRQVADLQASPGEARVLALRLVAQLGSIYTQLTIEERTTTALGKKLLGDVAKLRADFHLSDDEVVPRVGDVA